MGYGKGEASRDFGTWPRYSLACRRAVGRLLEAGGSLSAYRSNPNFPDWTGPSKGSWAYRLERLAEDTFHVRHAIAVNSGTMAIMAALKGMNLKPGEIITTPYTFSASTSSILYMGHTPVFADVEPLHYCLDPASVEKMVTAKTRAIMPVDLFGGLADYGRLKRLGFPIIQDACQAVGASKDWLYGDVATWSFNGAKNVPAGEAGMLVTNDDGIAGRARLFISHGENFLQARPRVFQDGDRESVGINGRLNEPTACIAYYGMKEVHGNNARRRVLASELYRLLRHRTELQLMGPDEIYHHALYVYPFRLVFRRNLNRRTFLERLKKLGVEAGGGYITPPLHKYGPLPAARTTLPAVEELSDQSLVLLSQVRPPATKADMRYIATCIEGALDGAVPEKIRKMGFISDTVF